MNHPSFIKGSTNISTPLVYSEEQRFSVIEKKLASNTLVTNSNPTNKYNFIPSFKQHKNMNMNLDVSSEYRKFKAKNHMTNAHKLHSVKIKKIFKYKVNNSDIRPRNDVKQNINIEDQVKNEMSDYKYDNKTLPQIPEARANWTPEIHQLRLVGDQSISMSKETDEAVSKSYPRPLTLTPEKNIDNLVSKKSIEIIRDSLDEEEYEDHSYISKIEKYKSSTIPVQPSSPYAVNEYKETIKLQPLMKYASKPQSLNKDKPEPK